LIGREEFVLIMPDKDIEMVVKCVKRITRDLYRIQISILSWAIWFSFTDCEDISLLPIKVRDTMKQF